MKKNNRKKGKYGMSFLGGAGGILGTIVTIFSETPWVKNWAPYIFGGIATISLTIFVMNAYEDISSIWENLIEKLTDIKELSKRLKDILDVYESDGGKLETIVESTDTFSKECSMTRDRVLKSQDSILQKMDGRTSFHYDTTETNQELIRLLDKNREIDELRIICYGRSGFGEIAQALKDKHLKLNAKVIMCDASKNQEICRRNDQENISRQAEIMVESGMKVYLSNIPPSIRACTAYIKGKPVWSTTQSYQFERVNNDKKTLVRPEHSLIIVCDENSSYKDFTKVVNSFNKEFERLMTASRINISLKEGKIVTENIEENVEFR